MNKRELIDELYVKLSSRSIKYSKWELVDVIDPFIEILTEALSSGKEVRLKNLGKFVVKNKKGHKFYNIYAGTTEYTPGKKVIIFTTCRSLQIKMNMHGE